MIDQSTQGREPIAFWSLPPEDIIPGDGRILEVRDLFVNEASLTGETFPIEKSVGTMDPDTPLARRTNSLFQGTSVQSGTAKLLVVHTGRQTEFGRISEGLGLRSSTSSWQPAPTLVICLALPPLRCFCHSCRFCSSKFFSPTCSPTFPR